MPDDPKPPQFRLAKRFRFDPTALAGAHQILANRLNNVMETLYKNQRVDLFLLESSIALAFAREFMSQMDEIAQNKVMEAANLLVNSLTKIPREKKNVITLKS